MKPIHFTSHAFEKLSLMRGWGFNIDEEAVVAAIRQPQQFLSGYSGRFIAQVVVDEAHVLRVVYEEDDAIVVVTMYPGRRQRYEDQI